jgi:hypothetical protein
MARDAQLNGRAARDAARIFELQAEIDDLQRQIDELAYDRDDLTAQLAATRRELVKLRVLAFEPVRSDQCAKVRHLHEQDARDHMRHIAFVEVGDRFHLYQCGQCPPMPVFGTQPWHVAHCRDDCGDTVWVAAHVLHHSCGCRRSKHGELLWPCDRHTLRLRGGAA